MILLWAICTPKVVRGLGTSLPWDLGDSLLYHTWPACRPRQAPVSGAPRLSGPWFFNHCEGLGGCGPCHAEPLKRSTCQPVFCCCDQAQRLGILQRGSFSSMILEGRGQGISTSSLCFRLSGPRWRLMSTWKGRKVLGEQRERGQTPPPLTHS